MPADNPFVGNGRRCCPRSGRFGLRNPWRYSFDDPARGGTRRARHRRRRAGARGKRSTTSRPAAAAATTAGAIAKARTTTSRRVPRRRCRSSIRSSSTRTPAGNVITGGVVYRGTATRAVVLRPLLLRRFRSRPRLVGRSRVEPGTGEAVGHRHDRAPAGHAGRQRQRVRHGRGARGVPRGLRRRPGAADRPGGRAGGLGLRHANRSVPECDHADGHQCLLQRRHRDPLHHNAKDGVHLERTGNSPFITFDNGTGRTGSGVVPYTVAANFSTNARTGTTAVPARRSR